MIKNFFVGSIFFILTPLIFKNIFSLNWISGGDYINLARENLLSLQNHPFAAWDSAINLGQNTIGILHYAPYNYLLAWVGNLSGYNNAIWERIIWWIPFFVLSFFSTYKLFKTFFPASSFWILSPVIFVCNSYVLMMLGGGQIAGVGLAYAIAPLVLVSFIKCIDKLNLSTKNFKTSIIAGLLLAVQVMFDLRIAYITMVAVTLYVVVNIKYKSSKDNLLSSCFLILTSFIIPLVITTLLHAFWLIPAMLFKVNTLSELGTAYNSLDAVKFFSFAKLENTIALLHPNWPENIFGKIYFMRAEFIIIPTLAYSALLFIKSKTTNKAILFFALLGLIGSFLAKGANEPFGQIYLWLFEKVPGFIMFRDATKWYLLIAISYAILIPFSISKIYELVKSRSKTGTIFLLLLLICYFFYLLHPIFPNQLGGTFKTTSLPQEYLQLTNFLSEQQSFSRVLWMPTKQKFGFLSQNHPAVYAYDFFNTSSSSAILARLKKQDTQNLLRQSAIKYIVVPYDSEAEIFLTDRKYDENKYKETIISLRKTKWLREINKFEKIKVFELGNPKDHFWSPATNLKLAYTYNTPAKYTLSVENAKRRDTIVFSERYDSDWKASMNKSEIPGNKYNKLFNSFILPKDGNYNIEIYYEQQRLVNIGTWISLGTLLITLGYLMF